MTINIFILKGELNGKIVVVRFFFCWVYKRPHHKTKITICALNEDSDQFEHPSNLIMVPLLVIKGTAKTLKRLAVCWICADVAQLCPYWCTFSIIRKYDGYDETKSYMSQKCSCADPESFLRGGPTQRTLFFVFFFIC